jgi:serine/threonine protein phosphatase PrpC
MWEVDSYACQGTQYRAMQDEHVIRRLDNGYLVLVCDGHFDGFDATTIAARELPKHFATAQPTIDDIRAQFARVAELTKFCSSGTTATLVFVHDAGSVIAGVLGDSLVIVGTSRDMIIGPNHNAGTNDAERDWAIERGAQYRPPHLMFGSYGLQMSRAFGNWFLADILNREPEIFTATAGQGSWVAVMSDGVLDTTHADYNAHCEMFRNLVENRSSAKDIVEHFLPSKRDDATLVLLRQRA